MVVTMARLAALLGAFRPLDKLPPTVKNRVLLRLNVEPCNCGCARSIAACPALAPLRDCQRIGEENPR
jgi:hypothetical protein